MAYDTTKLVKLGHLKTAMDKVNDEVTFTNSAATTATVGGIAKGTTFADGTKVTELLEQLLYPYVKPTVTIKADASIHELGVSTTRTLTVNVTKGSKTITAVKIVSGSNTYTLEATTGSQTQSVTVSAASTTFSAEVYDGNSSSASATASVTLTGVNPYYYGVVSAAPTTSDGVKALTKLVQSKGSKTLGFTTTSSAPHYCFAYPASYGSLKTILDQNGFDNTGDFTKTTVNVTNAAGTSVSYNVYTYNNAVAAGTMKFTFSI